MITVAHVPFRTRLMRDHPSRLSQHIQLELLVDSIDELLLQADEETPDELVPHSYRLSAADVTGILFEMGFGYRPVEEAPPDPASGPPAHHDWQDC